MEINWALARMYLVGQDSNTMYPSVEKALEAIQWDRTGNTIFPPPPAVILVYPGVYLTENPMFVPPCISIKAIAKWGPVTFRNDQSDMFLCSEFNWFEDFVVTQGQNGWIFNCNNASDVTVHNVNMYRSQPKPTGFQQGFLYQSGSEWQRLAIYDCLVDNLTIGGYSCFIENTSNTARFVDCFIDHVFFDAWGLNYFGDSLFGGSLRMRGCQDARVRYSTLRGAAKWNTSIRVEKGGVTEGQPQVDVRHCFTQGGVSLYNEPGTLITVVNCDSAGAIFDGDSIVHNSYVGPAYDPLHLE